MKLKFPDKTQDLIVVFWAFIVFSLQVCIFSETLCSSEPLLPNNMNTKYKTQQPNLNTCYWKLCTNLRITKLLDLLIKRDCKHYQTNS